MVAVNERIEQLLIEPGTLLVFVDTNLAVDAGAEDAEAAEVEAWGDLMDTLTRVAGHDRWCAIRIAGGMVIRTFPIEDVVGLLTDAVRARLTDPAAA